MVVSSRMLLIVAPARWLLASKSPSISSWPSRSGGVNCNRAESRTRIQRDGSQRRSQLVGNRPHDSFHAQEPVRAFASQQGDGACKSRVQKHCFDDQDGQQHATPEQNKATSCIPADG